MNFATSDFFTDFKRLQLGTLLSSAETNLVPQTDTVVGGRVPRAVFVTPGIAAKLGRMRAHLYQGCGSVATAGNAIGQATAQQVSGFGEYDAFKSDDRSIRERIEDLKSSQNISYAHRLAARIEDLLEGYREDMNGRVFSSDSLTTLISFLEHVPHLKYPTITLTRNGDFYLSWKQGKSHIFSAQFLRSKQVRFAIIRPHPLTVGQTEQFSGMTTVPSLQSVVEQYRVQEWAAA